MRKEVQKNLSFFYTQLKGLLISPFFVSLSLLGNFVVFLFAGLFYSIEKGINPNLNESIDAIWWSFSTVTTVGYGDLIPVTFIGKILGIMLMLFGTALFATYTALFANAFLGRK